MKNKTLIALQPNRFRNERGTVDCEQLPDKLRLRMRGQSPPKRRIDAAIALISKGGKLLICQRKDNDTFGGYWEFPGGKCEPAETLEQCLARELQEELAITARPVARLTMVEHDYPHAIVRLHPFVCNHVSGEIQHIECQASRWIDAAELPQYQFPPANESLIAEAIAYFKALGTPTTLVRPPGNR